MAQTHNFLHEQAARNLLAQLPFSMVISDPHREDCPIVYVNRAFEKVTGYSAEMALGRNCRFLQGDDQDQKSREVVRKAIENEEQVSVDIRNYRANGEPFLNRLMISPVHDDEGRLFAFIGIQTELTEDSKAALSAADVTDLLRETQHRVKNHLAMVASMIRLESRHERPDPLRSYDVLARRVEALSLLYDEFSQTSVQVGGRYDVVSAGGYVSRVASTVGALDGRSSVRLNIDADTIPMRTRDAANLGLILSEVLSNTFQHAFRDRREGLVEVRLKSLGSDRIRLTVADDGVGLGESKWPNEGNLGARLVTSIARNLGADLSITSPGTGTMFQLDLKLDLPTMIEQDGARVALGSSAD